MSSPQHSEKKDEPEEKKPAAGADTVKGAPTARLAADDSEEMAEPASTESVRMGKPSKETLDAHRKQKEEKKRLEEAEKKAAEDKEKAKEKNEKEKK